VPEEAERQRRTHPPTARAGRYALTGTRIDAYVTRRRWRRPEPVAWDGTKNLSV